MMINPERQTLAKTISSRADAERKLQQIKETVKKTDSTETELASVSDALTNAESDMASGDIYAWTYDTLRRFKASYAVDIPQIEQPNVSAVDLMPDFPYKQFRVTISGTAYYHDLGKFIAAFENTFPHIRILNVTVDPASTSPGDNSEKLSFKMDLVALIKPDAS
ncbi:MAG TPA: hypothetical protein VHG89_11765 [Verrucomicrobiae bacterium]|nr:hypothetical protein [Verrucomicrobiae bacterium]